MAETTEAGKNPFAKGGAAASGSEDPKDKKIADLKAQVADLKAQLKAKGSAKESADTEETDVAESARQVQEARDTIRDANRTAAELIVAEAFDGLTAPKAVSRVVEAAVEAAGYDALDPEAVRADAVAEAAEYRQSAGHGRPTGLGAGSAPVAESAHTITDEDILAALHGGI